MRNVGEPRDSQLGGGTYGFGKGIFYRLSDSGAILVDTVTTNTDGGLERRVMGSVLGASWQSSALRYTGRHWWGVIAPDGVCDPVLGTDADRLSNELGLPPFEADQTGTSVVVLAANLGCTEVADGTTAPRRSILEAAKYLRAAVLWNLWPKLVEADDGPPMQFEIVAEGETLNIPPPDSIPVLQPFVEGLRSVRRGEGRVFSRTVAPRRGGVLAIGVTSANLTVDETLDVSPPLSPPLRHVARMRAPELIVDYVEGPAHGDPLLGYAGVFKVSDEADEYFAAAEPPTHDGWVEQGLQGAAKGTVQGARRFIARAMEAQAGHVTAGSTGQDVPLGKAASRLANLLPAVAVAAFASGYSDSKAVGTGQRSAEAGNSGPRAGRQRRPQILQGPSLHMFDDQPVVIARVFVPPGPAGSFVRGVVSVVLEGGASEKEPPAGAVVPKILQWVSVEGNATVRSDTVMRDPDDGREWWLYVSHTQDAVVRVGLVEEGEARAG
jgi:hypothetical protein